MSSPPLRVFLNPKEDRSLWELTQATEIPQKVKERVQVLRLSSRGWKEERSYSSRQLCQILRQERELELSERHLRRILKKKLLMEKNKSLNKGEARPRS